MGQYAEQQMHVYGTGEFAFAVCDLGECDGGTTLHTLYSVFALGVVLPFWECLLLPSLEVAFSVMILVLLFSQGKPLSLWVSTS